MQNTPLKFLLLLGVSFLVITGNAQGAPQFNLHVVRSLAANGFQGAGYYDDVIDYHIEIDSIWGDAFINNTEGYPGFTSYFTPTPRGSLYKLTTNEQGVLTPIDSNTHFQLQYLPSISIPPGALLENYTTSVWECHGKCSRYELLFRDDINEPYGGHGTWYISPRGSQGYWESVVVDGTVKDVWRGVWDVKWRRGSAYEVPPEEWLQQGELAGLALVQADWTE